MVIVSYFVIGICVGAVFAVLIWAIEALGKDTPAPEIVKVPSNSPAELCRARKIFDNYLGDAQIYISDKDHMNLIHAVGTVSGPSFSMDTFYEAFCDFILGHMKVETQPEAETKVNLKKENI